MVVPAHPPAPPPLSHLLRSPTTTSITARSPSPQSASLAPRCMPHSARTPRGSREVADLARDHTPHPTALQCIQAGLLLTRLSLALDRPPSVKPEWAEGARHLLSKTSPTAAPIAPDLSGVPLYSLGPQIGEGVTSVVVAGSSAGGSSLLWGDSSSPGLRRRGIPAGAAEERSTPVAVKVVSKGGEINSERSIVREVQSLKLLSHDHIVKVMDVILTLTPDPNPDLNPDPDPAPNPNQGDGRHRRGRRHLHRHGAHRRPRAHRLHRDAAAVPDRRAAVSHHAGLQPQTSRHGPRQVLCCYSHACASCLGQGVRLLLPDPLRAAPRPLARPRALRPQASERTLAPVP